ncbi:cilia- and flagella-associated protein 90-like [Rhopilema esculentum]|uniref:cilia- and flagella-associated protein 90-like n=1 Tax=Rhopilema esculentum TaxID=499914 RepID=UPI0031D508EA|eukprot:gene1516-15962_t
MAVVRKKIVDTPEQEKNQFIEGVKREWKIRKEHSASKLEREGIESICRGENTSFSYFNNDKKHNPVSVYDQRFHVKYGYHQKIRRDDQVHKLGLDVRSEEERKTVPVLSSSVYGKRKPIDNPNRKHYRIEVVRQEFYRNGGTSIPSEH